ncbi:MAG: GAF domain-containing protein [Anaerolineales bacterium]|nr:GAF domain-containing protein [Anaerolineales bacterium]
MKPYITPSTTPINEALRKGETTLSSDPDRKSRLAIPIRLRGQVIGVMQLSTRSIGQFSDDDADIANAVADRLSLAIETATLLQSTQHRADIEKITANITSRVSSSSRFETILQTAAQELSRALGAQKFSFRSNPMPCRCTVNLITAS